MRARWGPWLVPVALLALAAVLRLPNLATRGTWDGDQGHDMLVLRTWVQDGVLPLLGPPTSIGDVHHGAWYYYLLGPVAFLTGGDSPFAIVATIALAGIAAVGVAWWLGRSIGGPWAGALAGLTLAVSTAAVDESTFIWNPNLIGLSSGLALTGAWLAWRGGSPWWWLLAAIGTAITMQCHILGVALLPVVAAPFLLDARRRPLGRGVPLAVVAVVVAAYLPLLVNELTTDFSEARALLAYATSDRAGDAAPLPVRFVIVGLRVVSWPLVGLITAALVPAFVATAAVVAIAIGRRRERAVRWLAVGLLWSTAFLTVAAPSLASVVPGLPNDHYHAFADPMVVVLVGLGLAALVVAEAPRPLAPAVAGVAMLAILGWNLTHQPPAVHPDGGWPAGEAAGVRVDEALGAAGIDRSATVVLRSIPDFKSTEAVAYPLVRLGRSVWAETPKGFAPGSVAVAPATPAGWVLLCDDLFRDVTGAACGGPAEDVEISSGGYGRVLDRFEAAPGRWITVLAAG